MKGYGASLIAALDNFFDQELTSNDLFSIVTEARALPPSHPFFLELVEVLEPLFAIRAETDPEFSDVFSMQFQWRRLTLGNLTELSDGHREGARAHYINTLKSYLLYYPRVTVGPLASGANFRDSLADRNGYSLKGTVHWFLVEVAPLLDLRALIERDIVLVSPGDDRLDNWVLRYGNPLGTVPLSQLIEGNSRYTKERLLNILKRSHWTGMWENTTVAELPRSLTRKHLASSVAGLLLDEIYSCDSVGANYVAPNEELWKLLRIYLSMIGKQLTQTQAIDWHLGSLLHRINLPNLSTLDTKDIVSLRLNEQEFQEWRLAVRSVLRHFADVSSLPENFSDEFRAVASELLMPRARQLQESVKRQRSLGEAAKGAATRFSLAVVGALFGGLVIQNPVGVLVGAASGRALPELWEIGKTRLSPANRALLRHYSLLAPVKPV